MKSLLVFFCLTVFCSVGTCLCGELQNQYRLKKVLQKAEASSFLKSLIVIQNGEVLIETYMNDGGVEIQNDIKSASKSIISA